MRRSTIQRAVPAVALGLFMLAGPEAGAALAADGCPNGQFRTGASANLPDCRAYERVSPPDSESYGPAGVGVNFQPQIAKARADGNRVIFTSAITVGSADRGGYGGLSRSTRTPDGWKTVGLFTTDGEIDLDLGAQMPAASYPSEDVSRVGFRTQGGLGGLNPGANLDGATYLSAPDGVGPPSWLSRPTIGGPIPGSGHYGGVVLGGSPDLSTAYFAFDGVLTSQHGDGARTKPGLYMNRNGALSPAGRLPSGNVDPGGALAAGSGSTYSSNGALLNASAIRKSVSRDGSRLFFVTPVGGANDTATVRQLYVQQDGGPGRLISKDQAGNPAATGVTGLADTPPSANTWRQVEWINTGFAFPSPDGSAVLFRSTSALAAGAPADSTMKTYRARITDAAVTVEYLPQVNGAPLAITDDATRVLYAVTNGTNDYTIKFWDGRSGGTTHSLATSSSGTGSAFWLMNVHLTPDGSAVLFDSSGEIVPGLTMPDVETTQTYRWSIGDARPTCVSCRTDGLPFGRFGSRSANLAGNNTDNIAFPGGREPDVFNQGTLSRQQSITDDGRRVFFDAIDPLVPEDTNAQRDVYMWEDGDVHLITSGTGTAPAFLIDSSASGDDVFFATMEPLVASDHNNDYDVYDARVGGGIAPVVVPSCADDGCQGTGAPVADATLPTSSLLAPVTVGSKSLLPEPAKKIAKLRVVRGKSTRRGVVLRVRTPAAGRIRAAGKGLQAISRKVKRSATYTVRLKLTSRTQSTLRKKGRVTVQTRVRFTPSAGKAVAKSVTVTVKRTNATNRKAR